MKRREKKKADLICELSLQQYFFEQLELLNLRSDRPVTKEEIFYSSNVLEIYSNPERLFHMSEGKLENKVLGVKMLESESLPLSQRKGVLRDIGDTALIICGFFVDSFERKIFDVQYYRNMGKIAYSKLNALVPEFYHVPSFYTLLADSFDSISILFSILAQNNCIRDTGHNLAYILTQEKRIKVS